MSRVGNTPVSVPAGVEVTIAGRQVTVKGPKGRLERELPEPITIERSDEELLLARPDDDRRSKAMHGLSRSLVANMITGVTEGYEKHLEIKGVGYRAVPKGDAKLELALGFSHPVNVEAPEGITFEVPIATHIIVRGIDKEVVGQVAANIRKIRKPEPYKGKGVRYRDEHVVRKAGKTAK